MHDGVSGDDGHAASVDAQESVEYPNLVTALAALEVHTFSLISRNGIIRWLPPVTQKAAFGSVHSLLESGGLLSPGHLENWIFVFVCLTSAGCIDTN